MTSAVVPNSLVRKSVIAMAAVWLGLPHAAHAEPSTKKSAVVSVAASTCTTLPNTESVGSDVSGDDWQDSELGALAMKSQAVLLDCAIPTPDGFPQGSDAAVYATAIELLGHDDSVSGSNAIQFSLYNAGDLLGSASSSSSLALPYSVGAGWHKSFISGALAHGKPLYKQPSPSLSIRVKLTTSAASFSLVRVYFTALY